MNDKDVNGEIVVYQPDEVTRLEVRVEGETVWLTQSQMAELFLSSKQNISLHINNVFREGELDETATVKEYLTVQKEGSRFVRRKYRLYNLDVIISVGYRVKSLRGTQFRQWALKIIKEYLLRGYSLNKRVDDLERRVLHTERQIEFFVRTSLPPVEGIFYDGQIFDAYVFASDLIRSAKARIILIDNYIDESVLVLLSKRETSVSAEIRTGHITRQLKLDVQKHNSQYPPVNIVRTHNVHDRFLITDDDVYHLGASLKDLGKKLFAFSKLCLSPAMLL